MSILDFLPSTQVSDSTNLGINAAILKLTVDIKELSKNNLALTSEIKVYNEKNFLINEQLLSLAKQNSENNKIFSEILSELKRFNGET